MASSFYPFLILLICTLIKTQVNSAGVFLEDGYTVSTILDGNKLQINPHSVLPQFGSSDLIILDHSISTIYTLSFATPEEKMIKKLAGSGSGVEGYADGELGSAMFNKPNSFAVDYQGNLYVADKGNHVIRKISKSGVTTIAGGYSPKPGKRDGPAQNASFSDEMELAFIPELCALIISDHGSKLLRQINLKAEDCSYGSHSVMGQASAWALGLGLSCLLGLIIGFVLRPYVTSRVSIFSFSHEFLYRTRLLNHCASEISRQGGLILVSCNKTWTHCLTSLGRQLPMLCFDMKNAVVSSTICVVLRRLIFLSLSTLSLMFRIETVDSQTCEKPVSLLDCDHITNNDQAKSNVDQLKDLICFGEAVGAEENIEQKYAGTEKIDGSAVCNSKIDTLLEANITGFVAWAKETLSVEHLESCLVRRR